MVHMFTDTYIYIHIDTHAHYLTHTHTHILAHTHTHFAKCFMMSVAVIDEKSMWVQQLVTLMSSHVRAHQLQGIDLLALEVSLSLPFSHSLSLAPVSQGTYRFPPSLSLSFSCARMHSLTLSVVCLISFLLCRQPHSLSRSPMPYSLARTHSLSLSSSLSLSLPLVSSNFLALPLSSALFCSPPLFSFLSSLQ